MAGFFEFREKIVAAKGSRAAPAAAKGEAISVAQLTRLIDRAIDGGVPNWLLVQGELSNVNPHASGHLYFTLKDAECCIDCVMWKSDRAQLQYDPGDGEMVLVRGGVKVYGARGRYQLYVKSIAPLGRGALEAAYRKLFAKLNAEGLFDANRKRSLPKYPLRIALLTSRDGAALQDMLKVLRRYPWLRLRPVHVAVQGDAAPAQIAAALRAIETSRDKPDVILLARGGGSLEDLWAFNDEAVARAIAAASIPIVTGIGHEVDTSIADLVADHHAHTPTEAAQRVVAFWRNVPDELARFTTRLDQTVRSIFRQSKLALASIERHAIFRRPMDRIRQLEQRLDEAERRAHHAMAMNLSRQREIIGRVEMRLAARDPKMLLNSARQRLDFSETRLASARRADAARRQLAITALADRLHALSPISVLQRGYSITTRKRGGAGVRSIHDVQPGDSIVTTVADGTLESTVEDGKQGRLFE